MQNPCGEVPVPKVVPPPAEPTRSAPPPYIGNANSGHDRIIVAHQPPEQGQKATGNYGGTSKYAGHLSRGMQEKAHGQRGA